MRQKICFLLLLIFLLPRSVFSADSSSQSTSAESSYDDIKFPQWAKDLRRTEIITFGSLPFVTMWTTMCYSMYEYNEFRNPLNKSTDGFTTDDQKKVMTYSAAICIGLGLTDLAINLISRSAKKYRAKKASRPEIITIVSSEDERKMQEERDKMDGKDALQNPPDFPREYFQGGVESALF